MIGVMSWWGAIAEKMAGSPAMNASPQPTHKHLNRGVRARTGSARSPAGWGHHSVAAARGLSDWASHGQHPHHRLMPAVIITHIEAFTDSLQTLPPCTHCRPVACRSVRVCAWMRPWSPLFRLLLFPSVDSFVFSADLSAPASCRLWWCGRALAVPGGEAITASSGECEWVRERAREKAGYFLKLTSCAPTSVGLVACSLKATVLRSCSVGRLSPFWCFCGRLVCERWGSFGSVVNREHRVLRGWRFFPLLPPFIPTIFLLEMWGKVVAYSLVTFAFFLRALCLGSRVGRCAGD